MKHSYFILAIYVVAVTFAFFFAVVKWQGLAYHTRDFPFYMEFYAKVFDPTLPDLANSSPEGVNLFEFKGIDGYPTLHHAIHFEPVKYILAALFKIVPHPEFLFLIFSALYFTPLLFLAYLLEREKLLLLCSSTLSLLYVLYPSSLIAATHDLRPFVLLVPALFFAAAAMLLRRSLPEQLFALFALFLVREEGIIFAIPLIGFVFVRAWQEGTWALALQKIYPHLFLWGAWVLAIVAYFRWAGFVNTFTERFLSLEPYRESFLGSLLADPLLLAVSIAAIVFAAALVLWYFWARLLLFMEYVLLAGPLLLLVAHFFLTGYFPEHLEFIYSMPYYMLGISYGIVVAIFLTERLQLSNYVPKAVLIAVCILFTITCTQENLTYATINTAWRERTDAAQVFVFRESIAPKDRADARIVTDYRTQQAFYDFPHAVNIERVPEYLVPEGNQYYLGDKMFLPVILKGNTAILSADFVPIFTKYLFFIQTTPFFVSNLGAYYIYDFHP